MAPDSLRPKRAAMAAALENPVWLNGKAPASSKQKRPRSPDGPPASTKKARQVAGNKKPPSKTSKPGRDVHATPQRPVKSRKCPVPIDIESDEDDGRAEDKSTDDDNNSDKAMQSDEEEPGDDEEVTFSNDPRVVRAMFESERAKWAVGANTDANSDTGGVTNKSVVGSALKKGRTVGTNGDHNTSSDEDNRDQDGEPGPTQSTRTKGSNRAANRLAEVPQWKDQNESDGTCKGTGSPLTSEEEEDGDGEEDEQAPIVKQKANAGWPSACHYTPASSGRRMISLRNQLAELRAIIRAAIHKVTGDALHESAYRSVDRLVSYHRHTLWKSAKKLNLMKYAKRFEQDLEFGKTIGRVINGRVSIYRGQVKRTAASKVEGFYQLLEGNGCAQKIKGLLLGSAYIYPIKQGPGGPEPMRSKPFSHPAILAVLREYYFANTRGGSLASKHAERFKSSVSESHAAEFEIPSAMLALVATSIHSALDDYSSGICRKTEFNADLYEDIYSGHVEFLTHIREGCIKKYHRMMADLYTQASAVGVIPRSSIAANDAIAQLDLDGMAE